MALAVLAVPIRIKASLLLTASATELATPTVTDARTYGHLTVFNI